LATVPQSRSVRNSIPAQSFEPELYESFSWVPFPLTDVFAFFANPENLPRLMDPTQRVQIKSLNLKPAPEIRLARQPLQAAGVGSEILLSFKPLPWLPLRRAWLARIVEFAWYDHFVDVQVEGPFAYLRHRHGFEAMNRAGIDGTRVIDHIEFVLPGGRLGKLLLPNLRHEMERQFLYRQNRLPELLEETKKQL